MNWRLKHQIQQVLSVAPGGDRLYYLLQRQLGGFNESSLLSKITQGMTSVLVLAESGGSLEGKTVLEIGTGWVPVIPMLFFVLGSRSCTTLDVDQLLKPDLTLKSARQMWNHRDLLIRQAGNLWSKQAASRLKLLAEVRNGADLFDLIQLRYHAPADARATGMPDSSFDIVFSNTTLEHIPCKQIPGILSETRRLLVHGGVSLNLIDCSDHFSHSDPNLSRINFLRYTEQEWQRYNTKFLYQNRLRASQYRRLFENTGFDILFWQQSISPRLLQTPPDFALAHPFRDLDYDDVRITTVKVVAQPQRTSST